MDVQRSNLDDVRDILEGLKKTAEGTVLHGFIARGLRKFGDTRVEAAFLAFAGKLLERYLSNPLSDPGTRVRVKVIQQRLRPYIEETAELLQAAEPAVATPEPVPVETPSPEVVTIEARTENPAPAAEGAVDTLPEHLARQMAHTLTRGRELDDLLRTSLAALNSGGDMAALKEQLARGIEELLDEHREIERQVATANQEMQTLHEDRRQLATALDRARKNSLTDELTGLPNRAAFLRQLEAEIGRARRYGFSLAIAILDVDNLKDLNTRHGFAAGDAVLHTYASQVMALFRGYDMVARYGDDEFAVLLPNTQKDGATRAMEKAQKQAAGLSVHFEGHNIPLPSFSSVLTLYTHGEAPEAILRRADEALSHAKQRGRAQAVFALSAA